jgi:tetratricopeptide (TPR) repeat protein
LVAEGQLEAAVPQFERVTQYMPPIQADGYHGVGGIQKYAAMRTLESDVTELARLALGRIFFELGRYVDAQRYYQEIRTESPYFPDQLFELVWVYLKQEEWLDAINQIEIFLIAYPDHQYAFQLSLLLGHLHMRRASYERALSTYEDLVENYGPIQQRLADIAASSTRPDHFFEALVESEDVAEVDPQIPAFAVSLLAEDDHVGRAVSIRREIGSQEKDLQTSQELIEQIAPVLQQGSEAVGTFRQGRQEIGAVQNDSIKLRSDVIDVELAILEEQVSGADRGQLIELRKRWDVLGGRAGQVRSQENDESDRMNAYTSQVREVQQLAFRTQQVALDQVARITGLKRRLRENAGRMSDEDVAMVRQSLRDAENELRTDISALERTQNDTTLRRVMRNVDDRAVVDTGSQRGMISDDFDALRADVMLFRRQVPLGLSTSDFQSLDRYWERARNIERRSLSVLGKLERAERAELSLMRSRLAEHMDAVIGISGDVAATSSSAATVASAVTRAGIGRVEDEFHETVMGADRGIVDVYWTRKAQVSDEIERLNDERGKRSAELDARFEVIRQRMGAAGGAE